MRKVRDEVQAKKLDGHTHSRLSVICIIKEKRKRKRETAKEKRNKKQEYIVRIYKLWTLSISKQLHVY